MRDKETRHVDQAAELSALQLFHGMVLATRSGQACKRQMSRLLTNVALNHHLIPHPRRYCGSRSHRYRTSTTKSSHRSRNRYCDNDMLGRQLLLPLNYDRELEPCI